MKYFLTTVDDVWNSLAKRIIDNSRERVLEVLGYTARADYGYTIDTGIAYGYLPTDYAEPGRSVEFATKTSAIPRRCARNRCSTRTARR